MNKKEGFWTTLFGGNKKESSCCQMEIVNNDSCCCTNSDAPTNDTIPELDNLGTLTSVKILGPGCKNCHALLENVQAALKTIDVPIAAEYITDMAIVAGYGILSTPALVINDKVVSTGRVLKTDDIIKLLQTLNS